MELSTCTFTAGQDRRTISYGHLDDSSACVRQVSTGDLAEFVFDCVERTVTVSFPECEVYNLCRVEYDLKHRGDDCYIEDYMLSLELWEVPFQVETTTRELAF